MSRLLPSISEDTEQRLVEVCLRQDCFSGNASIRAIFAFGELWEYRSGVPEANCVRDRVEKVLQYTQQQGVLALFVEALRGQTYPGMWDYDELGRISIILRRE